MSTAPPASAPTFTSGWLGAYFTGLMKVDDKGGVKKKMKAPRNAVPPQTPDAQAVLAEFIGHQHGLLNLLKIAGSIDLNRSRVPISIARFIKLKLGDTFMFFIGHQLRHAAQWQRAVGSRATEAATVMQGNPQL